MLEDIIRDVERHDDACSFTSLVDCLYDEDIDGAIEIAKSISATMDKVIALGGK